jgi:non-heme chloroperoxidase
MMNLGKKRKLDQSRRNALMGGTGLAAAAAALPVALLAPGTGAEAATTGKKETRTASTFTTKDGVEIYYKDWGAGQPVVFCHGWPLDSDSWENQMFHVANNGFRAIAHDRRGHGRSSQPWSGNDMDHYADDLAQLIELLDLKNVVLIGFSTGGGEVARYVGRHGTKRVAKLGLVSAVPPLMLKTSDNPGGMAHETFDGLRAGMLKDRSQLFLDIPSGPFYGYNRPGAKPSQGNINAWWMAGMTGQARQADRISGRTARPDRYAQGQSECRHPGIPEIDGVTDSSHDAITVSCGRPCGSARLPRTRFPCQHVPP